MILGTSHYGAGPELFSATRKNYATPFGAVETDGAFVDRLAARYSGDLFADEMLHRGEHSIEFQALFLAYALGLRGFTGRADSRQFVPRDGRERSRSCARFPG